MGNLTSKGRRKTPRFVMITHTMMNTEAWQDLTGVAVKLLLNFVKMHDGSNNGQLALTEQQAADAIGVSRNTASRALEELISHGFLRVTQRGAFHVKTKRPSIWRLTFVHTNGKGPTHEYKLWRP
jgi:CRP-like cAMP-binding protein